MLTTIRIAFRNTSRQKKRSFLLGGAIAFGMMIITLINGFTAGMAENVKENFSDLLGGHIFIGGTELTDSLRVVGRISDNDAVDKALAEIDDVVESINKRSSVLASIIFGSKQTMQTINGVDFASEKGLLNSLRVVDGSVDGIAGSRSLILPLPMAEKLGVVAGEAVLVKLSTVTGQQNVGEFRVAAVVEDQSNFGFSSAYGDLRYVNELLGLEPEQFQSLQILLKDMAFIDHAADLVYAALAEEAPVEPRMGEMSLMEDGFGGDGSEEGGHEDAQEAALQGIFGGTSRLREGVEPWEGTKFSVTTLNDVMQPVEYVVNVLNTVGLVVFIILLTITMVGIMNTFRMVLIERTKEIGTMRAFGMQRGSVRNIFLLEALFVGLGGAFSGIILSFLVMWVASMFSLSTFPALQFFLDNGKLSFRVTAGGVVANLLILMVMSLLAAYLPAKAAAKLDPAKALRTQH